MSSHSKPRLPTNILLAKILILLRTRIDNLNIHALSISISDIRSHDDELIGVHAVPYAFRRRVFIRGEVEFYSVSWLDEDGEED